MDQPLSSNKRIRRWTIACAVLVSAWFLVFKWNVFEYPYKSPYPSPNGEYYITMHQTPWESFWRRYPYGYGTARLYDRSGKLLYEGKTRFGDGAGPFWFAGFEGSSHYKSTVSMGEDDYGDPWIYELQTSPGLKLIDPELLRPPGN